MSGSIHNFYQRIVLGLFTFLIIFVPLYPKFPLLSVPGTYVSIRLEDFLIAFTILLWAIYQLLYNLKIFKTITFQVFLLFWFVGFVSYLSSLLITQSIVPHLGFLHFARRVEFMLPFWIAATTVKTREQVRFLLWVFVAVTLVVLLYGFGQLFLGFKVISTVDKDFSAGIVSSLNSAGRVNSTFAGHYDLSIYLSYFIIAMTGVFFHVKSQVKKIGIILIGLLSFTLLGFAASRISFAGTLAGIALVMLLMRKKEMIIGLFALSIVIVMIIPQFRERVIATVNVNVLKRQEKIYRPTLTPATTNNISNTQTDEAIAREKAKQGLPRDISQGESSDYTELEVGRSIAIRLTNEWPRALNALYKNPLLGTGYSSISLATDNDYLRALGETGILGIAALMLIFIGLLKSFISNLRINDPFTKLFSIITLGIVLDAAITALFIDVLEASKVAIALWIFLGIAWSQMRRKGYEV